MNQSEPNVANARTESAGVTQGVNLRDLLYTEALKKVPPNLAQFRAGKALVAQRDRPPGDPGGDGQLPEDHGVWSWRMMHRSGLDRMDREIADLGQRHLAGPPQPGYWEEVGQSLQLIFGDGEESSLLLLVKERDGEVIHASANYGGLPSA